MVFRHDDFLLDAKESKFIYTTIVFCELNKAMLVIYKYNELAGRQKPLHCENSFIKMKSILAIIFVITGFSVSSQTLEKIAKTFVVPDGWKTRVVRDTAYFPSFGKRHVGVWEFKCDDERTQSIWFYVFKYTQADSMGLQQKAILYYSLSDCLLTSNQDINENFLSFNKGNYFFVERMCPCYTKNDPNCKRLVDGILLWIKGKSDDATSTGK